MTAPVRLEAVRSFDVLHAYWDRAVPVRREWHSAGLTTAPADRAATEDAITRLYLRLGRARPTFEWVDSPWSARTRLAGLPTHSDLQRWVTGRPPPGRPPVAGDLAAALSRLRGALEERLTHDDLGSAASVAKDKKPWPARPPIEALRAGVPLREVLRQGVRQALETSLAGGFHVPVRAALGTPGAVPVGWYGQHDAGWIAHYDMLRRLGLGRYAGADAAALDDWAALARAGGWWWPGEGHVVAVERPAVVHTTGVPGSWHGQTRLDPGHAVPVEYRDGWRPIIR